MQAAAAGSSRNPTNESKIKKSNQNADENSGISDIVIISGNKDSRPQSKLGSGINDISNDEKYLSGENQQIKMNRDEYLPDLLKGNSK